MPKPFGFYLYSERSSLSLPVSGEQVWSCGRVSYAHGSVSEFADETFAGSKCKHGWYTLHHWISLDITQWNLQGLPIMGPLMVSFPYYSHTTPTRIPEDMGIVRETYHKGSHYWESLESPLNHWIWQQHHFCWYEVDDCTVQEPEAWGSQWDYSAVPPGDGRWCFWQRPIDDTWNIVLTCGKWSLIVVGSIMFYPNSHFHLAKV